jgi:hypothetical protein
MTGVCHYTQLFSVEMCSHITFPQADLKAQSSPFQLPKELDV